MRPVLDQQVHAVAVPPPSELPANASRDCAGFDDDFGP